MKRFGWKEILIYEVEQGDFLGGVICYFLFDFSLLSFIVVVDCKFCVVGLGRFHLVGHFRLLYQVCLGFFRLL